MRTDGSARVARRSRLPAAERRELIEATATELFAARGYKGASIEEIARRSGVTPPVVYDHFDSKLDLYRGLLERRFADLREVWRQGLGAEGPVAERAAGAIDAWFAYIEDHPAAARMLFREGGGDAAAEAVHAEVAGRSAAAVMPLFAAQPGARNLAGSLDEQGIEMAWVVLRGILQGLALWWVDHPEVPRERVVATAMNALSVVAQE
ncbi:MAG TPA: TetR/AcrR family transcriptional regulator [Solirubrobacterales bacterium]|nr:TetR/AcrR family transcriptional regulator [Solirubrobacterales bacterium]